MENYIDIFDIHKSIWNSYMIFVVVESENAVSIPRLFFPPFENRLYFITELNKIDEFIIKLVSMLISHSLRKWAAIAMKILSGSVKLYFFKWTNMGQQHYLIIFPRYCFSRFFISLLRWWHFARFMCIFSFVFIYVIALCCCLTRPFSHIT